MQFDFSRHTSDKREQLAQRVFEIIPGLTSWVILLGLCGLAVWSPIAVTILVIAFLFFWVLRLAYLTIFLVLSYLRLSLEQKTDWLARVRMVDEMMSLRGDPERAKELIGRVPSGGTVSGRCCRRDLRRLLFSGDRPPRSSEIYHLVIMPVLRERGDILRTGIESIRMGGFPPKQILVALALEERAAQPIRREIEALRRHYEGVFQDLLVVVHPDDLPGEARVKGANVSYAAKKAAEYFEMHKIPVEHVIVSCLDADTKVSHGYFGCLAYYFMVNNDRLRLSFQPIPVYQNNIWSVPGFVRVIEMGSSFFQLVEATNPEKLVTFSSHSMSFKALIYVGYWPADMISDDSAI
jgi:hypothetical protein